jgi:hypothetical protein
VARWRWHRGVYGQKFTFVGLKPVLQILKDYKTAGYKIFADIKNFLSSNPSTQSKILSG